LFIARIGNDPTVALVQSSQIEKLDWAVDLIEGGVQGHGTRHQVAEAAASTWKRVDIIAAVMSGGNRGEPRTG
jgi:hypothetical protein